MGDGRPDPAPAAGGRPRRSGDGPQGHARARDVVRPGDRDPRDHRLLLRASPVPAVRQDRGAAAAQAAGRRCAGRRRGRWPARLPDDRHEEPAAAAPRVATAVTVEIRVLREEQWAEFMTAAFIPFGGRPTQQDIDTAKIEFEEGRSFAAFDGDRIVGTTSVISMRMTVPGGGEVSTAGVTTVGVAPTHRRRGILRQMMRTQSEASREQGYSVAALWASEPAIYQRFGYGMATRQAACRVPRAHTAWLPAAPAVTGEIRLVPRESAVAELRPVYERGRAATPGMIARPEPWWAYRFHHLDAEHHRGGVGAMFYAVHEGPDGADGYAGYRLKMEGEGGIDRGIVQGVEAMTTTPESVRAVWSYLFGIDLMETIDCWNRPPDDALFSMVLDLRRFGPRVVDGLWARLLDVPAALSGRRYGVEGRVVFELRDEFCPWTAGRYELDGGPDGATCRPTDAEPELSVSSNELGAASLGGTRLRALA